MNLFVGNVLAVMAVIAACFAVKFLILEIGTDGRNGSERFGKHQSNAKHFVMPFLDRRSVVWWSGCGWSRVAV